MGEKTVLEEDSGGEEILEERREIIRLSSSLRCSLARRAQNDKSRRRGARRNVDAAVTPSHQQEHALVP